MPGLDGTGPRGEGPMTGGARGFCNPAGAAYRPRYGWGYGYGRGWGFRRGSGPGYGSGWGYGRGFGPGGYYPGWGGGYAPVYGPPYPMDPAQEASMLKAEADSMRSALDEINRRLGELEKQSQE
ncbi:MAG: DUF5320 domain-containing protein [Desulfobacterales bacterium]|nr:DUF5320 domain-containing protein [Desulfobacterales bacterium]